MSCPHCCEDAKFIGYRVCRPTCLFGKIVYERAYYHCRHCKSGWFPTDAEFGIEDHQTSGAREVVSLLGVLEPFEPSARRILPRLTGLKVSASTVQRTTESVGEDVAQRRAAGETFGANEAWEWNVDATGQRVAYVGLYLGAAAPAGTVPVIRSIRRKSSGSRANRCAWRLLGMPVSGAANEQLRPQNERYRYPADPAWHATLATAINLRTNWNSARLFQEAYQPTGGVSC